MTVYSVCNSALMNVSFQMPKLTRKSYTIDTKLDILQQSRESNLSRRKFAASKGISESTIRQWLKDEDRMRNCPTNRIRKIRYVPRQKKGQHPEVENESLG